MRGLMSTRLMVLLAALVAAGCDPDGKPCDPDQRYFRGLCLPVDPDAGVADDAPPDDAVANASTLPATQPDTASPTP